MRYRHSFSRLKIVFLSGIKRLRNFADINVMDVGCNNLWSFLLTVFVMSQVFAGPLRTTYQAKIIKPDGLPLEANSVNFKFTILNPAADCILYSETYSTVNMANTGGLTSFALGSGVKTYPTSSPTFVDIFSNTVASLSCDAGGPLNYSPAAADIRKIVMQFNDGSGWQTLPAMSINAVPYAMYANDSLKLAGVSATSYVQYSTIPTCAVSESLNYNGVSFSCVASGGGGGGSVTSSTVISALGYTPADGVSVTALSSSLSSTNSTVSSVSSTVYSVSSTVNSLSSTVASLSSAVSSITSSQWTTSGSAIFYNSSNVGIGVSSPKNRLTIHEDVNTYEASTLMISTPGTQSQQQSRVFLATSGDGTADPNDSNVTGWSMMGRGANYVSSAQRNDYQIEYWDGTSSYSALWIDSLTRFIGFGTSSPKAILHIAGNRSPNAWTTTGVNLAVGSNIVTDATGSGTVALRVVNSIGTPTLAASVGATTLNHATNFYIEGPPMAGSGTTITNSSALYVASGTSYFGGNVGIGTSQPMTILDVQAKSSGEGINIFPQGNNAFLTVTTKRGSSWADANSKMWNIGAGSDSHVTPSFQNDFKINYFDGSTTRTDLWIDSLTGNVGIGITAPTAKLHLAAGTSATAALKFASGTLLTSPQSGTMEYDGTNFYLTDSTNTRRTIATGSASGSIDNASVISNSSGNISLVPQAGSSVIVSSTVDSTSSNTGSLIVKGGLGLAGDLYSSGTIVTSSNIQGVSVTATSGMISPYIYGSTVSGGNLTLDSTTHSSKGNILLAPNGGNVGIKTTNPIYPLEVYGSSGPIQRLLYTNATQSTAGGAAFVLQTDSGAAMTSGKRIAAITMGGAIDTSGTLIGAAAITVFSSEAWSASGHGARIAFETTSNGTTARTEKMTLLDNGNLGIGTTSPSKKLEVQYGEVQVNTGSSSYGFTAAEDSTHYVRMYYDGNNDNGQIRTDNAPLHINTNGSGQPVILNDSNGNVGIGTNTPTAGLHLAAGTSSNASLKLTSGTLLTSPQSGTIEYDGTNFYLTDGTNTRRAIAANTNPGTYDNVSNINSSSNITLTPTGSVIVSSTTASTNSSTGALVVKGGFGVAGDIYTSGTIVTSSNIQGVSVTATSGMISPYIAGSIASGASLTLDSTTHANKGNILLAPNGGNVGIGTTSPDHKMRVIGKIKVGTETDNVSPNGQSDVNDVFELVSPNAASAPAMSFHHRGLHTVQISGFGTSVTNQGLRIKSGPGEQPAQLHVEGKVGIGTTNPTALLHLAAGTSATASFKLTSGTLLTSPQSGTMEFDGSNFYLTDGSNIRRSIAAGSSSGSIDNASVINSTGNISMVPAGSVIVSSTVASTNSQTGSLIVKGGLGLAGDLYTSGTIVTSSNIQGASVTATSGMVSPYIYGSTVLGGNLVVDSTTHSTKGKILLAPNGGNVGIGTATPMTPLHVKGTGEIARIETTGDVTALGSGYMRFNDVNGAVATVGIEGGGSLFTVKNLKAGPMTFGTSNTERVRIDSAGNLGIGTTNPLDTLDVSGTVSIAAGSNNRVILADNRTTTVNASSPKLSFFGATDDATNQVQGPSIQKINETTFGRGRLAFFQHGGADYTSESEVMSISYGGNVGIGTTSPSFKLQVYGSSPTNVAEGQLSLYGSESSGASGTGGSVTFHGHDGSVAGRAWGSIQSLKENSTVGDVASYMTFATRASGNSLVEKMRITSTGNVGIGATNPTAQLHVKDGTGLKIQAANAQLEFADSTTSVFQRMNGSGTLIVEKADHSNIMTFMQSGNVGVGTTSPDSKFEIVGANPTYAKLYASANTVADDGYASLFFATNNSSGSKKNYAEIRARTGSNVASGTEQGALGFYILDNGLAATPTLYMKGSDVGIGTANPLNTLHVADTTQGVIRIETLSGGASAPALQINDGRALGRAWNLYSGSAAAGKFSIFDTASGSTRLTIDTVGNVGIGTTAPARLLHVNGDSVFGPSATGVGIVGGDQSPTQIGSFTLGTATTSGYNWIQSYNSKPLVINPIGNNVGIGTTSPSYKLDVSGTIRGYGITDSSDIRLKKDIQPLDFSLEKLLQVNGVTYYWKDPAMPKKQIGFIAQQLEKIYPELVETDKEGMKSVNYSHLVAPVIEAIKTLYHRTVSNERRVASLENEVETLQKTNNDKEKQIQAMQKALCEMGRKEFCHEK